MCNPASFVSFFLAHSYSSNTAYRPVHAAPAPAEIHRLFQVAIIMRRNPKLISLKKNRTFKPAYSAEQYFIIHNKLYSFLFIHFGPLGATPSKEPPLVTHAEQWDGKGRPRPLLTSLAHTVQPVGKHIRGAAHILELQLQLSYDLHEQ